MASSSSSGTNTTTTTTTNASYRRVSTTNSDEAAGGYASSNTSSIPRRSVSERITDKIVALLWVFVATILAYWTNFFHVVLNPTESGAIRILLQFAAVGIGINTVLVAYLLIYLPYFKKLHDSNAWEVYCPAVIPVMTCTGVITSFLLIRATWPVWGFLAPLILGIETFGFFFGLHLIPALPYVS